MKNYQKYERTYFMPPEVTFDWAKMAKDLCT